MLQLPYAIHTSLAAQGLIWVQNLSPTDIPSAPQYRVKVRRELKNRSIVHELLFQHDGEQYQLVEATNKHRVALAEDTRDQRLKPSDPFYWTHMTHCYGLSYDDVYGDEIPTERYECKYGDDHICPAALFEDPWAEYERAKKSGEIA
jgi:hypothetical protein